MSILTITTDFGLKDGYVGVMKGVIWGIAPEVNIVDITHKIPVQDIFQAAVILYTTTPFFPDGTVHIAVVDPGVGTNRRAIAANIAGQFFVAPDNGVLTFIIHNANKAGLTVSLVSLDRPDFWLKNPSYVFHGRDIFAPVAAHLSKGVDLNELGTPINNPVLLSVPKVTILKKSVIGEVIWIDNYGNLVTNITKQDMNFMGEFLVINIKTHSISGLTKTINKQPNGTLVAFIGIQNDLIIKCVNGNAQELLNVFVGEIIIVSKADQ